VSDGDVVEGERLLHAHEPHEHAVAGDVERRVDAVGSECADTVG
jgi:hypothetical protein